MHKIILSLFCVLLLSLLVLNSSRENVSEVLQKAASEKNPVKSREIIAQAIDDYKRNNIFARNHDVPDEYIDADKKYFAAAVRAGDVKSIRELFIGRSNYGASGELKKEVKQKVLELARTSNDVNLLTAAAKIYGDDSLGVVDKEQHIHYLKRAWAAGNVKSAGTLAHIYVRVKDFENAYLWSLRCFDGCDREADIVGGDDINQIKLTELEKHLSLDKITEIQKAATVKEIKS